MSDDWERDYLRRIIADFEAIRRQTCVDVICGGIHGGLAAAYAIFVAARYFGLEGM